METEEQIKAAWRGTAADAAKLHHVKVVTWLDQCRRLRVMPEQLDKLIARLRIELARGRSEAATKLILSMAIEAIEEVVDNVVEAGQYVEDLENEIAEGGDDSEISEDDGAELDAAIASFLH